MNDQGEMTMNIQAKLAEIQRRIEKIERTISVKNDAILRRFNDFDLDDHEVDDTVDESPGDEDHGAELLKSYKRITTQNGYKLA